jgi:hypothetical protein
MAVTHGWPGRKGWVATMSPAQVDDGIVSFLTVLVVLLMLMLYAVVRSPPAGRAEPEDGQPEPPGPVWAMTSAAQPVTAFRASAPRSARAPAAPAAAV